MPIRKQNYAGSRKFFCGNLCSCKTVPPIAFSPAGQPHLSVDGWERNGIKKGFLRRIVRRISGEIRRSNGPVRWSTRDPTHLRSSSSPGPHTSVLAFDSTVVQRTLSLPPGPRGNQGSLSRPGSARLGSGRCRRVGLSASELPDCWPGDDRNPSHRRRKVLARGRRHSKKKRAQITDYRIEVRGERRTCFPRSFKTKQLRHIIKRSQHLGSSCEACDSNCPIRGIAVRPPL
jgi:hypothetical protein